MTTAELELHEGNKEANPVVRWRLSVLRRAGYDEQHARELASRTDIDLHRAVDLILRGCPPETAYRILI
jgi:hypothetical protein